MNATLNLLQLNPQRIVGHLIELTTGRFLSKVDTDIETRTAKGPFPKWGRHGFDGNACGQEAYRGAFPRKWCKNNNCQL